jgi:hypothetical protein
MTSFHRFLLLLLTSQEDPDGKGWPIASEKEEKKDFAHVGTHYSTLANCERSESSEERGGVITDHLPLGTVCLSAGRPADDVQRVATEDVGKRLQAIRASVPRLSASAVSRTAGLGLDTVRRIELGLTRPRASTLADLLDALSTLGADIPDPEFLLYELCVTLSDANALAAEYDAGTVEAAREQRRQRRMERATGTAATLGPVQTEQTRQGG